MAIELNADFNRFVQFATAQKSSSKAIADAVNGSFDIKGLARNIAVASGDKVGALFRSQTAKDINNTTRDIFRSAVVRMFGGESKIPESVKKAMEMKNFGGAGRPLTAKRIMLVKVAIDRYNAANPSKSIRVVGPGADIIAQGLKANAAKMNGVHAMSAAASGKEVPLGELTQQKAERMIKKSYDLFGYNISNEIKTKLGAMFLKYGNGMPVKNQRVLCDYIANKSITEDDVDEQDIANFAKDVKTWREFKNGDARLNKLSAKLIERQSNYVKDIILKNNMFSEENPNIFQQIYGDAKRAEWNLNGKKIDRPSGQTVVNSLTSVIKNPNALKVISILMNQGNIADLECLFNKSPALVGDAQAKNVQTEDIHTIPGADMFVSRDGMVLLADNKASYGFEISNDGKTATVTVSIDKDISSNGSKYNEFKIGTAKISQSTKIDLTKPMPEIVDVTFSQVFTPGKIRINPAMGPAI